VIDPRGGCACPECLRGNIWLTPDSYKIWLCPGHEKIIRKAPGWVRIDDEEAADWIAARADLPDLNVTPR
jgi:hypothetical protein